MKKPKDKINALARIFYTRHGYNIEKGYDFSSASHPQERLMFALAVDALNYLKELENNGESDEE